MRSISVRSSWRIFLMGIIFSVCPRVSSAGETAGKYFTGNTPHKIQLTAGKSELIQFDRDVMRTAVNDQGIAAIVMINPREVLVNGKAPGVTSLIAWNEEGERALFDIVVNIDTTRLASLIRKVIPDENIQVDATNERIVLSGEVEKSASAAKAANIAQAYLPEVVNLLQVKNVNQILLQVRFVEVERSAAKNLGVDLVTQGEKFAGHSYAGKVTTPATTSIYPGAPPNVSSLPADTDLYLELWIENVMSLAPVVEAMEERGLLRIIAEPNLIAVEGCEASFLAGGEVPIPMNTSDGVSIEWKEYGVRLNFTPTVDDKNSIRMKLAPEVSSLDFANGVNLGNFNVPALLTRRTQTEVELKEGESLIIGGLISQDTSRTSSKVPFLGDVPLLGKLFSSERFQKGESELLVMVTPSLVKPEDIGAAKKFQPSERLLSGMEAKKAAYRDARAERLKGILDGQKVEPVDAGREVPDEESLFVREPVKKFEDYFQEKKKSWAGEEVEFGEREEKILKRLPEKYKLIKEYHNEGL
ncbi:MAG: type II and III secretion system protein family protein [Candidatus Omnitrophota bacterium]